MFQRKGRLVREIDKGKVAITIQSVGRISSGDCGRTTSIGESHNGHVQATFATALIKAAVRMLWCGISMQPGSKGSFQAVKLQRPARATVCSHSTRDMAAMCSIESKCNDKET
jgi:hypothetical protein